MSKGLVCLATDAEGGSLPAGVWGSEGASFIPWQPRSLGLEVDSKSSEVTRTSVQARISHPLLGPL